LLHRLRGRILSRGVYPGELPGKFCPEKFCAGKFSLGDSVEEDFDRGDFVRSPRQTETDTWAMQHRWPGASTSIEDYAQSILLFSRMATFNTSWGAVIVPPEFDKKYSVRLKMHQIYFRPRLYPRLH